MKFLKALLGLLALFGAVLLFGAAGAADAGTMEFEKIVERCVFAAALIAASCGGLWIIQTTDARKEK